MNVGWDVPHWIQSGTSPRRIVRWIFLDVPWRKHMVLFHDECQMRCAHRIQYGTCRRRSDGFSSTHSSWLKMSYIWYLSFDECQLYDGNSPRLKVRGCSLTYQMVISMLGERYLSMSNEIFHIEYELVLVDATRHNRDREETFTSILHEFYKAVMGDVTH